MDEPQSIPQSLEPIKKHEIVLSMGGKIEQLPAQAQMVFFDTMDRFVIKPANVIWLAAQGFSLSAIFFGAMTLAGGTFALVSQQEAWACMDWYVWNAPCLLIFAVAQSILCHFKDKDSTVPVPARAIMLFFYLGTSIAFDGAGLYCLAFDRPAAMLDFFIGGPFGALFFAITYAIYVHGGGKKDKIEKPKRNERRLCGRSALGLTTAVSFLIFAGHVLQVVLSMVFETGFHLGLLIGRVVLLVLVMTFSALINLAFCGMVTADNDYGVKNSDKRWAKR